MKIKAFERFKLTCPVSAISMAPKGNFIFYALSYDWSKGAENNNTSVNFFFY